MIASQPYHLNPTATEVTYSSERMNINTLPSTKERNPTTMPENLNNHLTLVNWKTLYHNDDHTKQETSRIYETIKLNPINYSLGLLIIHSWYPPLLSN